MSSNSACTVSCDFCHYQILFISLYASFFFLDFILFSIIIGFRDYIYYSRIKDCSNIQNAKDIGQPQWVSSIVIREYIPANTWRLAWDMSKWANAFICLNRRVWRIRILHIFVESYPNMNMWLLHAMQAGAYIENIGATILEKFQGLGILGFQLLATIPAKKTKPTMNFDPKIWSWIYVLFFIPSLASSIFEVGSIFYL